MTTDKKIAANRANAKKSTGPTSDRGKSLARLNALKTGIHAASLLLPTEDPNEYAALKTQINAFYTPYGPLGALYATQMARQIWRVRRLDKAEYAALRKVEIGLALEQAAEDAAQSYDSTDDVEPALRHSLAREEREQSEVLESRAESAANDVGQSRAIVSGGSAPPIAYTLLRSYVTEECSLPNAEIDRQRSAAMKALMQLQEVLERMQEKGQKHDAEAAEYELKYS